MIVCPRTWRRTEGDQWHWIRDRHAGIWRRLDASRWSFGDDGAVVPGVPPRGGSDRVSRLGGQSLTRGGPSVEVVEPRTGAGLASLVVSPAGALWVFADPAGSGVAINDRPIVAAAVGDMDFLQVGDHFFLADPQTPTRRGEVSDAVSDRWRLHPLDPVRGIAIHAQGVTRRLGHGPTIGPIDLRIEPGRLVGIAAPSGTGKSQLARLLAKTTRPHTGRVTWRCDAALAPKPLGFAEQQSSVDPDLPAMDSLVFTGHLRGLSEAEAEGRAQRALRLMRLDKLVEGEGRERPIHRLSGGERHRVSVAAELLADHPLVIVDEPTTGLDPDAAARLVWQLRALTRRGQTVVMITHELELYAHCDRLIVLDRQEADGKERVRVAADAEPAAYLEGGAAGLREAITGVYHGAWAPSASPSGSAEASTPTGQRLSGRVEPVGFAPGSGWVWGRLVRRAWHEGLGHWALFVSLPILIVTAVYAADLRQPMMQYLLVVTTLWLTMSDAVLAVVARRPVWERERRLGLRPSSMLAGHAAYFALTAAGRVVLILAAVVLWHWGVSPNREEYSVLHGAGWAWAASLQVGAVLYLAAAAGTAMGLSISAACGRVLRAQQWLACLLLAQILLTVQLAAKPKLSLESEGLAEAVHLAAHLTAAKWAHDLLKLTDSLIQNPFSHVLAAIAWLAGLTAAAAATAWLGLRVRRGEA